MERAVGEGDVEGAIGEGDMEAAIWTEGRCGGGLGLGDKMHRQRSKQTATAGYVLSGSCGLGFLFWLADRGHSYFGAVKRWSN